MLPSKVLILGNILNYHKMCYVFINGFIIILNELINILNFLSLNV